MLKSFSCFWVCMLFSFSLLTAQRIDLKLYDAGKDGLTNGIGSIFQDSTGWMWFTRTSNVMRYDGNRFQIFPVSKDATLEFASHIREVNGKPWIFATPHPMTIERDSLVPLSVTNNRLDIMDNVEHKSIWYFLSEKGLSILKNNKLEPFIYHPSLRIVNAETLHIYNDSLLVASDYDEAIIVFNLSQRKLYKYPLPVIQTYKSPTRNLLVTVKNIGILAVEDILLKNEKLEIVFDTLYNNKVDLYENIVMDARGNVWATSQYKHLLKIDDRGNIKKYGIKDGLPNLWFNDLFVDREQNIWIAFNGGIARMFNTGIERYSSAENLYFDHINKFRSFDEQRKVFAFTPKGVNLFRDNQLIKLTYQQKPFIANDIVPTQQGFLAIQDSLFFSLNINTQTGVVSNVQQIANLRTVLVALEKDAAGTVFISSIKGLYAYAQNKLTKILDVDKYYRAMYIDKKQRLWLGEFTFGLTLYQIQYTKGTLSIKNIPLNDVDEQTPRMQKIRTISGDVNGNILVGTRFNGLFYLEMNKDVVGNLKHFDKTDGLKSNSIWNVAIQKPGKWWVCTDVSVETITQLEDEFFIRDESRIHQLGKPFDLALLSSDRVMLSSFPGMAIINNAYNVNQPTFSVFITGFNLPDSLFSSQQFSQKNIQLNHKQNNVQISFSANSYINEEAIQYSYQIGTNRSADWSEFSNNHTVNFSSLKPGTYIFRVKAMDASGVLSNNIAEIKFEILAPFWQRSWFKVLMILAIAGFFYALYRYRLRQITRLQNIRNSISNNLHDDIGASLSHINILNEMAKRNLTSPHTAEAYLSKSGDDIQRISETLSDIVWNINPRYDNLNNLFVRMKRYAAEVLEAAGIEAELRFPEKVQGEYSNMGERHDFYLIFKESLNNLVKYSKSTRAIVELAFEKHYLILRISDNGIGFHNHAGVEGNGLKNMQQRAEKMKADFSVTSSPGMGTQIVLRIRLK